MECQLESLPAQLLRLTRAPLPSPSQLFQPASALHSGTSVRSPIFSTACSTAFENAGSCTTSIRARSSDSCGMRVVSRVELNTSKRIRRFSSGVFFCVVADNSFTGFPEIDHPAIQVVIEIRQHVRAVFVVYRLEDGRRRFGVFWQVGGNKSIAN